MRFIAILVVFAAVAATSHAFWIFDDDFFENAKTTMIDTFNQVKEKIHGVTGPEGENASPAPGDLEGSGEHDHHEHHHHSSPAPPADNAQARKKREHKEPTIQF